MHLQYSFLALISITYSASASFFNEIPLLTANTDKCDCHGTKDAGEAGASYICGDKRLGPKVLPKSFPLLSFVSDYDRFGGLTPGIFLSIYTYPNGSWIYPPGDGFQWTGTGEYIKGNMTLIPGTLVDRFGYETGHFLSAADAPYAQRSLPPKSLDTPAGGDYPYNYHIYRVIKPLWCMGGPIVPWFGQPGLGAQFDVSGVGNIQTLLAQGYLEKENISALEPGAGRGGKCGL